MTGQSCLNGSAVTEAGWHDPATAGSCGHPPSATHRGRRPRPALEQQASARLAAAARIAELGAGQFDTYVVFPRVGARVANRFQCTICPETGPKGRGAPLVRAFAPVLSCAPQCGVNHSESSSTRNGGASVPSRDSSLTPGNTTGETLTPLRIVALLERSGGRASRRRLAARLRISLDAVDDAIEKLESTGVVTAARMQRGNDVTIALYRRGTASGRRAMTPLGAYDTSSYRAELRSGKPN